MNGQLWHVSHKHPQHMKTDPLEPVFSYLAAADADRIEYRGLAHAAVETAQRRAAITRDATGFRLIGTGGTR